MIAMVEARVKIGCFVESLRELEVGERLRRLGLERFGCEAKIADVELNTRRAGEASVVRGGAASCAAGLRGVGADLEGIARAPIDR